MSDFFGAFVLLNPKGAIGSAELGLMVQATLFMLIVAVPVFFLIFFFAWRYRASNRKARYQPNWEHSKMEELIWWAIPFEIVLVLGALTWSSTHALHPPNPINENPPLVIQAVALDWKWLFIYPEQGVASLNYVVLPVGQQVRFDITADAPMNSFWIPALGGQIYAMTGMITRLHLIADEAGEYDGRSANFSGEGFANMKFIARASSPEEFDTWIQTAQQSPHALTEAAYTELKVPSRSGASMYYSAVMPDLFEDIVAQFTDHSSAGEHIH